MTWVATGTATITAAEIAAAEAAAIAAAEAAAVAAAETAATEAAAAAAAEGASTAAIDAAASAAADSVTTAATDVTSTAAAEAAPGSILDAAAVPTPAEPMTPAGLEQVAPAGSTPPPPTEPLPPAGSEQAGIQTASGPATSDVAGYQSDQAMIDMIKNYQGGPQPELSSEVLKAAGNVPQPPTSTPGADSILNAKPTTFGPGTSTPPGIQPPSTPSPLSLNAPPDGGGFMQGFNQFVNDHPFYTGAGIYGIASATGMLNQTPQTFGQQPTSTFNNPYKFSPNFKASHPDANVYKPSYSGYAGSGYAAGGITQASVPTPGLMDGGQAANVNFMGKDMYPMSQQDPSRYATPTQMPTSAQQTMASYEANTNPLTGEVSMAAGGQVPGYAGGGSLLEQLLQNYTQNGVMPTQEEYLGLQGLHSSFNPDYAFDQAHARFIPMSSVSMPDTGGDSNPVVAPPSSDQGGGYAGGSMPDELSYAGGGIARYYRGELATSTGGRRDVYGATQRFLDMYDPQSKYNAPVEKGDAGIFRDTNPSTRDKSAADASNIRANAIAKKAQVNTGAKYYKPSVAMGQLNLGPQKDEKDDGSADSVLAARGGIMQANLGGYAAGGNPRLLRGPGDGMSDNIPATIGGKQPARLADGEFVVPADVVSHLGNGSTEAGASKLHGMMDKVRMDRTGKKKQAPAVKAGKYIPK